VPDQSADPIAGWIAGIDAELADFLSARRGLLATVGVETDALAEEAAQAVAGGKRLRALFCLAGWQAAGGHPADTRAWRSAAALELLQASALVHDDLMDGSATRRGRPAAHRTFEQQHVAAGWIGSRTRFGAGAAILLGDLLLTWAHELLRSSGFDQQVSGRAAPVFDVCTTEVTAGQFLDLVSQASGTGGEDLAMRVMRFKSASYTVVRPLQLGAALAGGGDDLMAGLTAYGEPIGLAFQLRDDVLGVFGDPERTGKHAGDDLREGKRTVLLARTYERSDAAGRALLDRCIGNASIDSSDIHQLRELMTSTGALASVEQTIAEFEQRADRAAHSLAQTTADTAVRTTLDTLTAAALQRSR